MKQLAPDDPALLTRVLIAISVMGTSMLLWIPCAACSLVFFLNDYLYELTIYDPLQGTALVDVYRHHAEEIKGKEWFYCYTRRSPGYDQPDDRDLLLRVMESADRSSRGRQIQVGFNHYSSIISWVERLDLAILRHGTAIDREHSYGLERYDRLYYGKMDDLCDEQVLRQRLGQPLLPPIEAYAESRAILLEAAARMETALARYAEVRPWLLAFFYAWIAYCLLGLACAIYLVRLNRRIRASASAPSQPAVRPPAGES